MSAIGGKADIGLAPITAFIGANGRPRSAEAVRVDEDVNSNRTGVCPLLDKADKVFWPGTVCPLMNQSGHAPVS